jgi:outer membrane protein OmpA-like peptidoglycan-associated protein
MQANALEKAGAVATPCLACHEAVYVKTDERGKIEDIYVGKLSARAAPMSFAEPVNAFDAFEKEPVHFFEEDDEDEFEPRRRATIWPLALVTVGLLFAAWVASTLYVNRARPAAPVVEGQTPTVTPTAMPSTLPTSSPASAAALVLDSLSGVSFPADKAELSEESQLALREAVETLKALPKGSIVEIGGHTDEPGSEAQNKQLSLQRAEAVRQYLIKQGIPAANLKTKGYGATQPLADSQTELGKAQNRRIEFRVVKKTN